MHDMSILAIIWFSVFVASYLAHLSRLTPVLWYLFCGALLVNIGAVPVQMPEFIHNFSELGIIVIMFALGFEEETDNFIQGIKRSWGIALFGALIPFAIAYSATYYFWNDANMALLCGLAMTATAVSLTMVSLKSEGLSKLPAATGIMTSAILERRGNECHCWRTKDPTTKVRHCVRKRFCVPYDLIQRLPSGRRFVWDSLAR